MQCNVMYVCMYVYIYIFTCIYAHYTLHVHKFQCHIEWFHTLGHMQNPESQEVKWGSQFPISKRFPKYPKGAKICAFCLATIRGQLHEPRLSCSSLVWRWCGCQRSPIGEVPICPSPRTAVIEPVSQSIDIPLLTLFRPWFVVRNYHLLCLKA